MLDTISSRIDLGSFWGVNVAERWRTSLEGSIAGTRKIKIDRRGEVGTASEKLY
jgi:hypothetical protein